MIEARMQDGTSLQFPDGTDDAVIDRAVGEYLSSATTRKPPETPDPVVNAEAASIVMPNRFARHTGTINPGTLPTTDQARASVEKWSTPEGLSLSGMLKSTLLGVMDIGQGRVKMNESGNPLSIRLTDPSLDALGLGAGISPAAGTGRAVAQMAEHGSLLSDLYARNRYTPPSLPPSAPSSVLPPSLPPAGAPIPEMRITSEPQSLSAAGTPSAMVEMAPREAAASRATGERSQMMDTPIPGDTTEYVPGVLPTKAEIEQNAAVSREAKSLRLDHPQAIADRELHNAERYYDYFSDVAGTPTIANRAIEARAEQATKDLKATWANKGEADIQPVFDVAAGIKSGPDGRRPLVRSTLDSVTGELTNADGKHITDPEMLYGVRKHIDDLLSKEAQREKPLNKRAEAALMAVKDALDLSIEAAAPGFKQYLANFANASKPIDVMELLQEAVPKLFQGPSRTVAFHRFDRFMKDIASDRAAPGINQAKSIPDDVWEKLVAMHKSLQRSAAAEQLARAPGSDTVQNAYDVAKRIGMPLAHVVAGTTIPFGVGNLLVNAASKHFDTKASLSRLLQHHNPDLSKYQGNPAIPNRGIADALINEQRANSVKP